MERETVSSTNQNQSKTLDGVISWTDLKITTSAYARYLSSKGEAFLEVSHEAPQAIPSALEFTYTLEEWSGCKNLLSLINDQESLKSCKERYSLMDTIMRSISQSLKSLTSEELKTFMKRLSTLQNGQILNNLYLLYEKTRYAAEVLEIVDSYNRDGIFIRIISEYLKGFEWPSEYVIKAQLDKKEIAFKLLWKFEKGCY